MLITICKIIEFEALSEFKTGRNKTQAFAAYCIYVTCKKQNVGRTLTEISSMCFISVADIIKYEKDCEFELFPSQLAAHFCAYLCITN